MGLSKNDLKQIAALKSAHGRKKHQAFLVEGPKLVEELLNSDLSIKYLIATEDWVYSNPAHGAKAIEFKQVEMDKLSLFPKANQVIAVVNYPKNKELKLDFANHILVLDTIQDPGNFGTIIRTADWFGIQQIVCSEATADAFNPKVVQASMGSVFRVDIQYTELSSLLQQHSNIPVYGTLLEGTALAKVDFQKKGFIVIGNESKGISEELKKLVSQAVFIPRGNKSKTESLNASVACGILLSHLPK